MSPLQSLLGVGAPPKPPDAVKPIPAPPPLPTPPGVDDADTKARLAAAEYQDRAKKKRNASTILTGAQGVLGEATTQTKQLFGS